MKKCIWCTRTESDITTFNKRAHTFPQSLGGENICENVCDDCNHYFGATKFYLPGIEIVLKEVLNISRYLFLKNINELHRVNRFKSIFFKLNIKTNRITLKYKYSLKKGFQRKLGRQFKRGIYKVFLEERERQRGDALDSRFDFIREFSRYNLGDYPLYIRVPELGVMVSSTEDLLKPQIRFTESSDKMDKKFRIYEYLICGHNFCIPTSNQFDMLYKDFFEDHLIKENIVMIGTKIKEIKYAEDVDYTFSYMNSK